MFHLLWACLIFSMISIRSSAGASVLGRPYCHYAFCISVSETEITAESGLCVVIPCSFTTPSYFKLQHLVWFKCKYDQRCSDSDIIFHTNENTKKTLQPEFTGRVSLLDPDVNNQNCSIIVQDLRESDSGYYQLRVNGYVNGKSDGFTFYWRTYVNVGGFRQKPTMTLPDLIKGHQATLTCTAPALCSTSPPGITWEWRGAAEKDPLINGSITAFKNESLTAVTQRHHSTLTFIPTDEHHNSSITCKIRFSDNTTTQETVSLHVNYVKITGKTDLKESTTLNLTCTTSVSPAEIQWNQFGSKTNLLNRTAALPNNTAIYLQKDRSTLVISNVTAEDAGLYICTSKHLNNTIKDEVNVTVMYQRKLQTSGKVIVKEGEVLNLTCSVDSFPPAPAVWSGPRSNLHNESDHKGSATFIIVNVTAEDSGKYICAANHQNWTETVHMDVTVMLEGSACVRRSDVLTCTCIAQGFPLANIKWPQLSHHTEYSVITNVSARTVRSSLTLRATKQDNVSAECVISNESGESTEKLTIQDIIFEKEGDQSGSILEKTAKPEIIIAFLIGVLTSAVFCILIISCYRKKLKRTENLLEIVEMVGHQENPLIHDGFTAAEDQNCISEGAENGAVSTGAPKPKSGSGDVEYANIDFSLLKRKERTQELQTAATEYAEVKVKKEGKHAAGEEEAMMEEDDKTLLCVSKKTDAEEEAVYSSVNDLMDEV